MVECAVIVAAGMGNRLGDVKEGRPKGFLKVGDSVLIERSVDMLLEAGIERVLIGTGFGSEYYEEFARTRAEVSCVYSPDYETTSSMHTLACMAGVLDEDFLLLESDLVYERAALEFAIGSLASDLVLASGRTNSGDEVYIETDAQGNLVTMSKDVSAIGTVAGELVGISRISMPTFGAMCSYAQAVSATNPRLDYELALVGIAESRAIPVLVVEGLAWAEIDDASHLQRAQERVWPIIAQRDAAKLRS